MVIDIAVEGQTDAIFLKSLLTRMGYTVGVIFGQKGIHHLLRSANGYAQRGRTQPIIIVADYCDIGESCPGLAASRLVPQPCELSLVRVAVREIESWIMASRLEVAHYFGIGVGSVPEAPDGLPDPKRSLINVARCSQRSGKRSLFVPSEGTSGVVAPEYLTGVEEFLKDWWSLDSACENSPSLRRFVEKIKERFPH